MYPTPATNPTPIIPPRQAPALPAPTGYGNSGPFYPGPVTPPQPVPRTPMPAPAPAPVQAAPAPQERNYAYHQHMLRKQAAKAALLARGHTGDIRNLNPGVPGNAGPMGPVTGIPTAPAPRGPEPAPPVNGGGIATTMPALPQQSAPTGFPGDLSGQTPPPRLPPAPVPPASAAPASAPAAPAAPGAPPAPLVNGGGTATSQPYFPDPSGGRGFVPPQSGQPGYDDLLKRRQAMLQNPQVQGQKAALTGSGY